MHEKYPSEVTKIFDRELLIYRLSEEDPYFRSLRLKKENFEPEFVELVSEFLPENGVCIDVGANIGLKSLALAQICERGRVVAVEAGPVVSKLLRKNVANSNFSNIAVVDAALTDFDGQISFTENSAYGHIAIDQSSTRPKITAKTLKTLKIEQNLNRVDFVKIDVEGHEYPILKSVVTDLSEFNPLILVEFNSWCQIAYGETNPKVFIEWILKNFKFVYQVNSSKPGHSMITKVIQEDAISFLHANLVQNGCVDDLLLSNDENRSTLLQGLTNRRFASPSPIDQSNSQPKSANKFVKKVKQLFLENLRRELKFSTRSMRSTTTNSSTDPFDTCLRMSLKVKS